MLPDKWKIYKINNATGAVTIKHEDGKTLQVVIPKDHKHNHEKAAYMKGAIDHHEGVLGMSTKASKKVSNLMILIALEAAVIIGLLIHFGIK